MANILFCELASTAIEQDLKAFYTTALGGNTLTVINRAALLIPATYTGQDVCIISPDLNHISTAVDSDILIPCICLRTSISRTKLYIADSDASDIQTDADILDVSTALSGGLPLGVVDIFSVASEVRTLTNPASGSTPIIASLAGDTGKIVQVALDKGENNFIDEPAFDLRIYTFGSYTQFITTDFTQAGRDLYLGALSYALGGASDVVFAGTIPSQAGTQDSVFVWDAGTSSFTDATAFSLKTGTLQAGLSLNTSTGEIEGTPTGFGTDAGLSIEGTGSGNPATSNVFSLTIDPLNVIFTGTIPGQAAAQGSAITYNIGTGSWANATSFLLGSGILPAGYSVNASTGDIEGTTSAFGVFAGIAIQGDGGGASALSNSFAITVTALDVVFSGTVPNQSGDVNTLFSYNIGTGAWADATSFALASGTLQAGLSVNASTGDIEGTPTASGTNLGISIQGSGDGNPDTSNTFDITIDPEVGPDPFAFDAVFGAELSTVTESSVETITGFGTGFAISSGGADYRIDGGSYVTAAGTIDPGQTVQMRQTSSASFSTLAQVTLTIDTETANFDVRTKPDPAAGGESIHSISGSIAQSIGTKI